VFVTFISGNFDQLKLFNGCADCGIFFLGSESIFGGGIGGPFGGQTVKEILD
jgi:hypothetical protein